MDYQEINEQDYQYTTIQVYQADIKTIHNALKDALTLYPDMIQYQRVLTKMEYVIQSMNEE